MLYYYLKTLLKKDSSHLRVNIIKFYTKHSIPIRLASLLYKHNPPFIRLILGMVYQARLLFWHLDSSSGKRIAVAVRKNEVKALQKFLGAEHKILRGSFSLRPFGKNARLFIKFFGSGKWIVYIKIAFRLSTRLNLIQYLRALDYLSYTLLHSDFVADDFFHSSEGDPLTNALCAVVKRTNGKVSFVEHGIIPLPLSPFPFDNIFILTKRNFLLLKKEGKLQKKVIWKQTQSFETKMIFDQNAPAIGIVDSLLTNEDYLLKVVANLRSQYPTKKIILRLHPNRKNPPPGLAGVLIDANAEFSECLFVLCGNTGHAVKILQNGHPALYDSKLDSAPYDLYWLIRDGILLEGDATTSLDFERIISFYSSTEWTEKWKQNFINDE